MFKSIGNKINLVVGSVVALALLGILAFYTTIQQDNIMAQNERTMNKLTESVIEGLQTIMISGYADVAEVFAERLRNVKDVKAFQVLRVNGDQAFKDNETLDSVNRRKGEEMFLPREKETKTNLLSPDHPSFQTVLNQKTISYYYEEDDDGSRLLTFLAPILSEEDCHQCHGSQQPVRGVLKLTTSMSMVEADIRKSTIQTVVVMLFALVGIFFVTRIMMNYTVIRPISEMTSAMSRVSMGHVTHQVPVIGRDELSQMATIFNQMSSDLKQSYDGLEMEQGKLTTIIQSADEGIVVTNGEGDIVLINPAAALLLKKDVDTIIQEGFVNILDDPLVILNLVSGTEQELGHAIVEYKDQILDVSARTIFAVDGKRVGSAALMRNVTEEKLLENQLRELSTTDGLTRLFNRRHLDITLAAELDRAARYNLNLSIIMFDVDHFKKFNDEHGHDQGDRVLQTIGSLMKQTARDVDIPCRYGGEEFLVILPNTTVEGGMKFGERMRKIVEETAVDGLNVTISIGVATYPQMQFDKYDKFIEAADKALYRAKEAGRNQVCMAQQEEAAV